MSFTFTEDYKTDFKSYIDELFKSDINDPAEKNVIIERLTEGYFSHTADTPDSGQLERLASWLLKGIEWEDDEAYVLTDRQMRRKNKEREYPSYSIDDVNRELSIEKDGHTYKRPLTEEEGGLWQKTVVRFPNDKEDKRKFNDVVRKHPINIRK